MSVAVTLQGVASYLTCDNHVEATILRGVMLTGLLVLSASLLWVVVCPFHNCRRRAGKNKGRQFITSPGRCDQ